MAESSLTPLTRCLSRLAGNSEPDLSDAQLLERFHTRGEEGAFTLLVQRHGPAVRGVCRRVLGEAADADDAFQATFLVLLRKADSIRRRAALGCWLYGVACRVAAKARARRVRPAPPGEGFPVRGGDPAREAARRELADVLDEEIRALPERYRGPLVLCVLEGRTYEQAARELGASKSALGRRVGHARELLRRRLARRGVAVPAALFAAVLAKESAAAVPTLLTLATVRLAAQTAKAGAAPASPAADLARGVGAGAGSIRWAAAAGLAAAVGFAAAAVTLVAGAGGPPPRPGVADGPPRSAAPAEHEDREGLPLPAEALARVGSARLRHGRGLQNLSYSPDGRLLASSGKGLVRLWDAAGGKPVRQFVVPDGGRLADGLFSADGKTVLVVDGETCRWLDVRTGGEARRCAIKFPKANGLARLAPGGQAVAIAGTGPGQDLVVYELPSGKERFRKAAEGSWAFELALSPDGTRLAAVELDRKAEAARIRLFETASGRPLGAFDPGDFFDGLTFSPDGKKLLGQNARHGLDVWDVPSGDVAYRFGKAGVYHAAFTPDGACVFMAARNLGELVIDLATGKEVGRLRLPNGVSRLAFAPDGRTLAVGDAVGVITQWERDTGRPLAASADPAAGYRRLRFDPGGKLLWACADAFAAVDWRSGREERRARVPGAGDPAFAALSPDATRVGGTRRAARYLEHVVWDAASGKELCACPTDSEAKGAYQTFSPDGKTLYAAEWIGPVRAWDVDAWKERPGFGKGKHFAPTLAASPDGRWLAAADLPDAKGAGPAITVWDLHAAREARRLVPRPDKAYARDLAFGPGGAALAAAGFTQRTGAKETGFVTLWDVRTGQERFSRTGLETLPMVVAFSADGRLLATGGVDGDVRLWEVATGRERHRFAGHALPITGVALSPDGKLLAAASADAPLFVWDVEGTYGRPPAAAPPSAEASAGLWKALDDPDAAAAFGAMRQLLARPGPAVALLRERLRADPAAGAARAREVRAVEVLERIGTPEARELLEALSGGAAEAPLTREARAASERLRGR